MVTAILLFSSVALLPVLVKIVADLLEHIAKKREDQGKFEAHSDLHANVPTQVFGPRL
jgi:hypothetical protein